jgi:hypothetical protein
LTDFPPLHRDPFDRMLSAQAQTKDMTIVTPDLQIGSSAFRRFGNRRRAGLSFRKPKLTLREVLSSADKENKSGDGMAVTSRETWCPASIRNTNGISLEEISRNTKIKVSTLQALEKGEFEQLPGGIYNISYIRQYARAIGADEGSLVDLYRTKFLAPI